MRIQGLLIKKFFHRALLCFVFAACSEPTIALEVKQPTDGYTFAGLGIEYLLLNILHPPIKANGEIGIDCESIAYQDVSRAEALEHMVQQTLIPKGKASVALSDLDRTKTKLFWLEGYGVESELLLSGCAPLEPSDKNETLKLETEVALRSEVAAFDPSLPITYGVDIGGGIPGECEDEPCVDEIRVALKVLEQAYVAGRQVRLRLVSGLEKDSPTCGAAGLCVGGELDGQSCSVVEDCRPVVLPDLEDTLQSDSAGEVAWDSLKAPAGISGPLLLEVVARWQSHEPHLYTLGVSPPGSNFDLSSEQVSAFEDSDRPYGFLTGDFGPVGQPGVVAVYLNAAQDDEEPEYDFSLLYFGGGQVTSDSGEEQEGCSSNHDANVLCYQTSYGAQNQGVGVPVLSAIGKGRQVNSAKDTLIGVRGNAWDKLELTYNEEVPPTAILFEFDTNADAGIANAKKVFAVDDCSNGALGDELLVLSGNNSFTLGLHDLSGASLSQSHIFSAVLADGAQEDLFSAAKEVAYSACVEASDGVTYRVLIEGERNLNVVLDKNGLVGTTWSLILSGGLASSSAVSGVYAQPAMIFGVRPLGTGLGLVRSQLLVENSVLEIQEQGTDTIPFLPQKTFAQDFDGDGALDVIALLDTGFGISPVVFYMVRGVKYKGVRIAGYVAQTGIEASTMELLDVNCDGVDEVLMLNEYKGAGAKIVVTSLAQGVSSASALDMSLCTFSD